MFRAYRFGCVSACLLLAACVLQHSSARSELVRADIQTTGRSERTAEGWLVTWPGVAWRTAFSGTSIGIDSQDLAGYHVEIDGQVQAPVPTTPSRLTTWYRGFSQGRHVIEVIRMGATPRAPGSFYGFALETDARWLKIPAPPARQLVLLGDSNATGYGDLSTSVDCPDNVLPLTDASQSYAVLAARSLHADWQLNAMDGIGLVRNWRGIWRGTDYGTYASRTLQSDPASLYADARWHPQVAVLAIGFNDLATPPASDEPWTDASLRLAFNTAYRSLLTDLRRSLGPEALIIVMTDPLANNPGNEIFTGQVEAQRADGDQRIFVLPMPALERTGCNYHPNLADHGRLSAMLVNFIQEHGGFEGAGARAHEAQ
jgi:lysophospholipase L1-like esterase